MARHGNIDINGIVIYPNIDRDSFVGTEPLYLNKGGTGNSTFTSARVLVISSDGTKMESSSISTTKLGYLTDVTSNIQAQIDTKASTVKLQGTNIVSQNGVIDIPTIEADKTIGTFSVSVNGIAYTFNGNSNVSISITPATVGAAPAVHKHVVSDITDDIPASKITGVLSLDNIPQGARERMVVVESESAMLALTKDSIQTGDTVKINSESDPKMYYVKDDTILGTMDAFEIYRTGAASSVPWTGVLDKPSTYPPSAHTHDITEIKNVPTELPNPEYLSISLNGGTQEGVNKYTYTGNSQVEFSITPANIGAAAASHGTHVTYGTTNPLGNGTASPGTAASVSRSDHIHPLQGSVAKLTTARTITIGNKANTFDGSANITYTVAEIGAVRLGGDTISGTYVFSNTNRSSGTSYNSPPIVVGGASSAVHVEIDGVGIMAKTNATSTADLYLNKDGGTVHTGENISMDGDTLEMKNGKFAMIFDETEALVKFQFA